MRYLQPIRWHEVQPGTVIMSNAGVACTVLANNPAPTPGHRIVQIEGVPGPLYIRDYQFAAPVELDEGDAIGNLLRAGFTVKEIPS